MQRIQFSNPWDVYQVGDIADLDDDTAKRVVIAGYGIYADGPPAVRPQPIVADQASLTDGEVLVWNATDSVAESGGPGGGGGSGVASFNGRTGAVVLSAADVTATGALDTKADLVGGVVPTAQLPALAIGQTVTVATQAAMLALTAAQVQPGDVAIRSDQAGRRWLLAGADPSVLGNWIALETPDAVTSVNGQAGAVVLGKADVGLGNVDNTSDANKPVSTAQQTALNAREVLISRTGAITGQVPVLQANGTLAFATVSGGGGGAVTSFNTRIGDIVLSKADLTGTGLAKADVGLGNVDNTSDANKPVSTAQAAALAAKADLVGGVIPTAQLPAIATGQTVTVASQAAMLALTAAQVQPGDVAIRSDQAGRRWLLAAGDPSVLANWIQLETPDAVTSVNGQAGAVVLAKADVGLGNVDNTSDANKPVSTAQAAADALRVLKSGDTITGILKLDPGNIGVSRALDIGSGSQHFYVRPRASGGVDLINSANSAVVATIDDAGVISGSQVKDGGNRVYSPNNPPPDGAGAVGFAELFLHGGG